MTESKIPVEVTISSDQIDKAIIDSLVGTQLGQKIAKEIEKCFGTAYGQADVGGVVARIVKDQIQRAVESILLNEHGDTIKEFVREKMTNDFVTEVFESMWKSWSHR